MSTSANLPDKPRSAEDCGCKEGGKEEVFLTTKCGSEECRKEKRRKRNWTLWVSLTGLIALFLHGSGALKKMGLDSESLSLIIMILGSLLTAFGIIKKPEKG